MFLQGLDLKVLTFRQPWVYRFATPLAGFCKGAARPPRLSILRGRRRGGFDHCLTCRYVGRWAIGLGPRLIHLVLSPKAPSLALFSTGPVLEVERGKPSSDPFESPQAEWRGLLGALHEETLGFQGPNLTTLAAPHKTTRLPQSVDVVRRFPRRSNFTIKHTGGISFSGTLQLSHDSLFPLSLLLPRGQGHTKTTSVRLEMAGSSAEPRPGTQKGLLGSVRPLVKGRSEKGGGYPGPHLIGWPHRRLL